MSAPKLESAGFGWLIANGTRYDHDLIITVDGEIVPRPKHLSKKYGGSKTSRSLARWHTVLGPEEIEPALAGDPEILLVACGHFGVLPIRAETRALLAQRGVPLERARVHDALKRYDELTRQGKRVAAILHLTC